MKRVLFLLLALIMLLALVDKSTFASFTDSEDSSGSSLTSWQIVTVTRLNDGFEGDPWQANWDDNGITDWGLIAWEYHSGGQAVQCQKGDTYLTSDNLDTSAVQGITISFWLRIKDLKKGPLYVQIYDGSNYHTLYDIFTYPGAVKNTWYQYTVTITDSQYFRPDFRLRFDGSGASTNVNIDDVLITVEQRL